MLRPRISFSVPKTLIPGTILLLCATFAAAQNDGVHGIGAGGLSGISHPDGVDEKDTLHDFHHALAVQATSQQIAEFQELVKSTNTAKEKLQTLVEGGAKPVRENTTSLDQALEDARSRNEKFQDGFSEKQKSGLKEIAKKLERAESDLELEAKRMDQTMQSEAPATEVSVHATALDKALTNFSNQQLSLGREMGIVLASGQDLAFSLPKVRNRVNIGSRTISLDISGALSQVASQGNQRTFQFESTVDLSELQQTITEVLNSQLAGNPCGVRLAVQRATIMAATPASSVVLRLHYERWSCTRSFGQNELAESNGAVEIKLTPAVENSATIGLTSEFKRIDAAGMMADDLRTGDVGDMLRDKVASSVLAALRSGADLNTTVPAALQNRVTLQTVRFQEPGGSGLQAHLQGQVQLSNEQVNSLANQLNQTMSAQLPTPSPAQ